MLSELLCTDCCDRCMGSKGASRGEVDSLRAEVLELRALVARLEQRIFDLERAAENTWTEVPAAESGSGTAPASASSTSASRREICREVGQFLRRSLSGLPRGSSGRDRLELASRYWIVVKDFDGNVFSPPRVFGRFGDCKGLVKRGSDCGDSIFVGLPSREDVVVALEAGSFELPDGFRR